MPQPYCVYYPNADTNYYLYQRYPNFPNLAVEVRGPAGGGRGRGERDGRLSATPSARPTTHNSYTHTPKSNPYHHRTAPHRTALQGVTNEHFIVWMRTAGLPTFRKLYGRIDQDIPAGTLLSFAINPGFEVVSFGGKKHLGACCVIVCVCVIV